MRASMRFYAELNRLILPERRQREFMLEFEQGEAVRDLIEACGVPLSDVDLVLVDGESASPSDKARDGSRIAVFPVFESFDLSGASRVRSVPLMRTRFAADAGLERLAEALASLGFDVTVVGADPGQGREERLRELQRLSRDECRIVLTLDPEACGPSGPERVYCPKAADPGRQLLEVLERFHLKPPG